MILKLNGNVNKYYAQTLCMVFFPGSKFSEEEEENDKTPVVSIDCVKGTDTVTAHVTISIGAKSVSYSHTEPIEQNNIKIDCTKIAVGIAFYKAGERFFNYTPPWGILTGVRPSKLVADLYKKGLSVSEAKAILTKKYMINSKKATLLGNVVQTENKKIKQLPEKSCSVYISIPFCPTRCAYCSFVSYSTPKLLAMIPDYLEELKKDIAKTFDLIKEIGMTVSTVYIGGGTPTILNEVQLTDLLECINASTDVSALKEFTLEAGRPDTVNMKKMRICKQYGVTRVSVNPQTLNNSVLESIGRKHTVRDFRRAFDNAVKAEINCINTDLIAGLPGESFNSFSDSIDKIIKLRPQNITIHTFCIKKASDILRIEDNPFSLTGGEAGKSVDYAQVSAKNAGYIPYYLYRQKNTVGNYENVGFSLPGYEGLYNIFMMEEV
ncbi:MAG: coproporphyrinogen dehydrogenase HemZ, partial [Clostridia bacterium]|nr:coproporphyrinogen dehydrogenase HemZ [Clostridia bacterium]